MENKIRNKRMNIKICDMLDEVIECIEKDNIKQGLDILINGTKLPNFHQGNFNGSKICLQVVNMWIVSDWKDGAIEFIEKNKPKIMELDL